jgi:hypothetical protein
VKFNIYVGDNKFRLDIISIAYDGRRKESGPDSASMNRKAIELFYSLSVFPIQGGDEGRNDERMGLVWTHSDIQLL